MLALFDELRSYEVTPEILYQQAQDIDGATHDKLTDLSLLYAAYEARLRRPGLDARDRMTKLCDHLEESGYVRDKDIFIDGFTYFNAQERRALADFSAAGPVCHGHAAGGGRTAGRRSSNPR